MKTAMHLIEDRAKFIIEYFTPLRFIDSVESKKDERYDLFEVIIEYDEVYANTVSLNLFHAGMDLQQKIVNNLFKKV